MTNSAELPKKKRTSTKGVTYLIALISDIRNIDMLSVTHFVF